MASTERRKPSPPLKETSYNLATRRFLLRPSWYIEDILCGLQLGIAHFLIVFFTYSVVPEPYMDEIFHIRQTRRYCKGDFSWDPMITTPPALYFLALPFCKYGLERYVNTFLIILLYIGCCRFRRLFTRSHIKLTSLVVCLLPVLLHTAALFYTDVLSLCAVVWAFTLGTSNAAVCFLIACCARQTNIVWAGFYALVRMYHHYDEVRPIRGLFKSILKLWPFLLLATGFLAFLILNGGIVLGDPKAHQAKPHFAQLLYFLAFAAAHSSPQALPFIGELVAGCFTKLYAGLCLLFVVVAKYFTYDHPYLLADNRHVPFYLWRWFLRHESIRLAVTPIYAAAALFLLKMSSTIPRLIQVLFIAATAATLVPAHLIEPRYFIIPYVLWRLSASPTPIRCIIIIEILMNFGVFSWYFFLFLYRPFEWSHEPGTQRFMW